MTDLSIIIVSWNTRELLRDCLTSIHTQTPLCDFEIMIIDNASDDNSSQMVRRSFPHVKLIENDRNLGFARACNQGLRRSSGRYAVLLNPDTWVFGNALEKMIAFLDDHGDVGALGPRIVDVDGVVDPRCARRYPTLRSEFFEKTRLDRRFSHSQLFGAYLMTDWDHRDSRDVEALSGACLMVRREVLVQVGLLDESFFMYGEDTDWCYRIRRAGWRVFYYSDAQVAHVGGQSTSPVSEDMGIEALQSINRFFLKHYGPVYALTHRVLIAGISLAKQLLFMSRFLFGHDRAHYRLKLRLHRRVLAWAVSPPSQTHLLSARYPGIGSPAGDGGRVDAGAEIAHGGQGSGKSRC